MKILRQFTIILVISFLGEGIKMLIPLPIPSSVWGLVLMLAALQFGIMKVEQVKEASSFLIEIMPVMFIPAGVGLITAWPVLKPVFVPVMIITALSTVIVMAVTGIVTQKMIKMGRNGEDENVSD